MSKSSVTSPAPSISMRPLDLIRKKRDGGELSSDEIEFLVRAYTRDAIPDYQMAAWLMAVVIRGMTRPELTALTSAAADLADESLARAARGALDRLEKRT